MHNPKETLITIREQDNKLLQVKWTALETTGREWGGRNMVLLGHNFINTRGNYAEIICLECRNLSLQFLLATAADSNPAHLQRPWNHQETSPELIHTSVGQIKQMDWIQSKHWNSGSVLWHLFRAVFLAVTELWLSREPHLLTNTCLRCDKLQQKPVWSSDLSKGILGGSHLVNKWARKIPCSAQTTETHWKVKIRMPRWKSQNDSSGAKVTWKGKE